jgi:hypothetical protein
VLLEAVERKANEAIAKAAKNESAAKKNIHD